MTPPPSWRDDLWLAPIVIGVAGASGLVSALVSDGWGDVWSWLGLGFPVAAIARFACLPSPRSAAPIPEDTDP